MRQNPTIAETLSSTEGVLRPTDTLLRALRMMKEHRVALLPVVGQAGGLVGLVSREHVLAGWRVDPLLPVAVVMAACERAKGARPDASTPAP